MKKKLPLMKNELNHIIDILFLVSLVSAIVLSYLSIGCDYLRWNLNLICWGVVVLTSIIIFVLNIRKWKNHLIVLLSLISITPIMVLYFVYMYHPRIAETSRYVVRDIPALVDPGHFCLYEKDGIWENLHSTLCSDELVYKLNDFQVYEDWGVASVFLELNDTWKKEFNASGDSCFKNRVCIIDSEKSKVFKHQIDSLKQAINAVDE